MIKRYLQVYKSDILSFQKTICIYVQDNMTHSGNIGYLQSGTLLIVSGCQFHVCVVTTWRFVKKNRMKSVVVICWLPAYRASTYYFLISANSM